MNESNDGQASNGVPALPPPENEHAIVNTLEFTNAIHGEEEPEDAEEGDIAGVAEEGEPLNTAPSKGRGLAFSSDELLLVARSYMITSEDAVHGTSQKANVFWESMCSKYNALVAQANALHKEVPGYVVISKRTWESLRGVWRRQLQPAVAKFAGIVLTNPPPSGHKKDDAKMNLYYENK
jgi:hypothetical protein